MEEKRMGKEEWVPLYESTFGSAIKLDSIRQTFEGFRLLAAPNSKPSDIYEITGNVIHCSIWQIPPYSDPSASWSKRPSNFRNGIFELIDSEMIQGELGKQYTEFDGVITRHYVCLFVCGARLDLILCGGIQVNYVGSR